MDKIQKFSEITKDHIKTWKQTRSGLEQISIALSSESGKEAQFVICKPTRGVLSAVVSYADQKNLDKVNDLLIENCVLGGDMVHLDKETGDVQVYLTLIESLGKLMEPLAVTSKKL